MREETTEEEDHMFETRVTNDKLDEIIGLLTKNQPNEYVYILRGTNDDICGVYTTQNAAYREACALEGEPLETSGNDTLLMVGVMRGFNLRVEYSIERFLVKGET